MSMSNNRTVTHEYELLMKRLLILIFMSNRLISLSLDVSEHTATELRKLKPLKKADARESQAERSRAKYVLSMMICLLLFVVSVGHTGTPNSFLLK